MVQIGIDLKQVGAVPADLAPIYARGPVLINVASLVREKNHQGLLRIFSRVAGRESKAQLLIVGKGALGASLKEEAVRLGLSDRIHFVGARKDVLELVQAAQVFVLPSIIEGLPGVILEAQYCKTPVVANDVGGISEVVQSGATGWLVPKGDEAAFDDAVGEVLRGGARVDEIVGNAHAQILGRFDNRVIAERFETVYKRVVARG
jgi:glycosyltransferase involved in cell wall biosynthesis